MSLICQGCVKVLAIVLLVLVDYSTGILCYNGTVTSRWFGEDPLTCGPRLRGDYDLKRLRCFMTTRCPVPYEMWGIQCCAILSLVAAATGLYCYNCSETHQETNQCAGVFGTGAMWFNASRLRLTNCSGDNAMCFVRSWSMRSKHSWLVQRGCYKSSADDTLPRTVRHPTRSMSCKRERYKDAEYKVCLCQADWCNSAQSKESHRWRHLLTGVVGIVTSILMRYLYLV